MALISVCPVLQAAETLIVTVGNGTAAEDKLYNMNDDGTSPTVLVSSSSFTNIPARTSVDRVNRRIYVCDQTTGGGGIHRFNADGSGKLTVFTNATSGSQVLGVAADGTNGFLYFAVGNATAAEDKLYRAGLDGSSPAVIVSGASLTNIPNSVAVDTVNQRVYVVDQATSGGGVFRFDSNGANKTTIYANSTSGSQVQGIAVDSSRGLVYFVTGNATASEDKLFRCDLNGGSLVTLVSGASLTNTPGQVTVDPTANRIYVADATTSGGGVFRFNSDGSSKTTIFTNSTTGSQVLGLAMLPPQSTTVNSLNRVNSTPSNASTVNWTLTFGSATTGVTASNFSLSGTATSGASIGTPTTANSGLTWNIPVTTGSGTGTLQLDFANATGLSQAISTSLPFSGQAYSMDKTAPTISIGSPSASLTTGGPVSYTITYSDPNFNTSTLANGNVTLNSTGTASGSVNVTGSGTTRTVTISSITGDGTLGISIAAGTASDTAGNTAPAAGPSTTFTVDNTAPGISIGAPSASATTGGPVSYTITYSGQSSISLSSANVTVNSTGSASAGTVNVTGSGSTRTVELSSITGDGTLGISIAAGTASDTAGNSAPAAGPSATFAVDNTAPTISIGAPSASVTAGGPVSYTVTYSGQSSISLSSANITVNSTGSASAGTVNVTGSGSTRTVELSSVTGDGTLGISIAAGTASDSVGNNAGAAGPSATFTVDNTAPTISIGAPSASLTNSGPISYTVTYSGESSITLSSSNVTVNSTGTASAGTVNVTGTGSTRTVELSSITGDGTLGISIAAGTASDTAGNSAPAAGPSATFTVDNTAPVITSTLTDNGTYRSSYSYSITASGSPVTYGATGLPAGLSVDGGTGAISGTPTASGSFSVSLTATDAAGNVGSATLNLSIAQVPLSITGLSANNKPYDANTSASLSGTAALSGVNPADTGNVSLSGTASGTFDTATVGTNKTVTVSGLSLTGSAAGNYTLLPLSLTADITAVQLTVTADNKSRPYGAANPTLTATITGFVGGENSSVVSGSPALSTLADSSSAPGAYTITAGLGSLSATNYTFGFVDGTLTVTTLTFEDWQEENFTPSELLDPDISGPTADPDLDNVTNLYEYAFGTDPNNLASGPNNLQYSGTLAGGVTVVDEGKPIAVVEVISGSTVTRVLFLRRKAAFTSDLDYTPQFSANGTIWIDGTAAPTFLADDGLYELVSVPYPLTTSGKKTRFFRVTAELDAP